MVIDFLANHKEHLSEVVELVYRQWADLFQAGGTSKEQLRTIFEERAVTDKLPVTLVAVEDGALVGTGSIKLYEPGTTPGVSPWLAGVYVKEPFRSAGVGAAIVARLEAIAGALGVQRLYLSVGSAERFYERLGWVTFDRVHSYGVKDVAVMVKQLKQSPASQNLGGSGRPALRAAKP